jgi:hypothetical protein
VEPGFFHLGWRELLAIWLGTTIIVDWAAQRYLRAPRPAPPAPGRDSPNAAPDRRD